MASLPMNSAHAARERISALAAARGISLAALSRMIGRNGTYLQQFITKGSPRRLAEEDRRKLARFFGVAEAELGGSEDHSYDAPATAAKGEWIEVPRLPVEASAGSGAFAMEEAPFDVFRFSRRWLRGQGLDPTNLSTLAVAGDSMEPELRDGDEILIDRTPRPLREGIHVVRLGDVLHVKRIQAVRPGTLTLISANPAYPTIEIAAVAAQVIGRVVWKGGRL